MCGRWAKKGPNNRTVLRESMAMWGWVVVVMGSMLFLKIPKEPDSHWTKKTPRLPAPQRKKAWKEIEKDWRI